MQVSVAEEKKDVFRSIRPVESNGASVDNSPVSNRIGIAKGKFSAPEDFDDCNEEIYEMVGFRI